MIGPVRWTTSSADHVFEKPPESISTSRSSDGGTRDVMGAFGHDNPSALLAMLPDEKQQAQVIADPCTLGFERRHYTALLARACFAGRAVRRNRPRAPQARSGRCAHAARRAGSHARDLRAAVCKRHRAQASSQSGQRQSAVRRRALRRRRRTTRPSVRGSVCQGTDERLGRRGNGLHPRGACSLERRAGGARHGAQARAGDARAICVGHHARAAHARVATVARRARTSRGSPTR